MSQFVFLNLGFIQILVNSYLVFQFGGIIVKNVYGQ